MAAACQRLADSGIFWRLSLVSVPTTHVDYVMRPITMVDAFSDLCYYGAVRVHQLWRRTRTHSTLLVRTT